MLAVGTGTSSTLASINITGADDDLILTENIFLLKFWNPLFVYSLPRMIPWKKRE
jgi:hypothetical protein